MAARTYDSTKERKSNAGEINEEDWKRFIREMEKKLD
jgi:uncharacterized membrane protein